MYGYIYKTTNLFNGKIYIGQHKSEIFDVNYYGSGVRFLNVFNKYGKNSFKCELLEECSCEDELNEREQYWISYFNSTNKEIGYNLMSGGYKIRGIEHSDETKRKISKSRTGIIPNRVYKVSDETRAKISVTLKNKHQSSWNKGKHLSDETKEKLRQVNLGKKLSEETKEKMRGRKAWNKGIPMSENAKKHLRELNKGKSSNISQEGRRKISESHKGEKNCNYGGLKDETKEKIRQSILGRIWVTNGNISKQIKQEEFEYYQTQGFYRGRMIKS